MYWRPIVKRTGGSKRLRAGYRRWACPFTLATMHHIGDAPTSVTVTLSSAPVLLSMR